MTEVRVRGNSASKNKIRKKIKLKKKYLVNFFLIHEKLFLCKSNPLFKNFSLCKKSLCEYFKPIQPATFHYSCKSLARISLMCYKPVKTKYLISCPNFSSISSIVVSVSSTVSWSTAACKILSSVMPPSVHKMLATPVHKKNI